MLSRPIDRLPSWVPEAARHYLAHTESGLPLRVLARTADRHASTILRQVRRFENRRDDPLVDDALRDLSQSLVSVTQSRKDRPPMTHASQAPANKHAAGGSRGGLDADIVPPPATARIEAEGLRVLRRLCESGAVLAVAREMDKAVVVRDGPEGAGGAPTRTAVVDRDIAQAMALNDWITCADANARIARYRITAAGRAALRRMMAEAENRAQGFAEAQADFAVPRNDRGEPSEDTTLRHMRSTLAESPLAGLARRRDRDGKPFLSRDLVISGERLREDFELSQSGPRVTQNWDRFLTATATGGIDWGRDSTSGGAAAARERVSAALAELGPGLGDVALRCCCLLEGMETLEQRMGWSARSGKIVLRIALQRLRRHYENQGRFGPRIG